MATQEELNDLGKAGTTPAPDDQVWVCGACGKTSRTKYGVLANGSRKMPDGEYVASQGWDESCMMHAILCYKEKNDAGNYKPVKFGTIEDE